MLNDGESLLDAVPPHYKTMFEGIAANSADNTVCLPYAVWREAFINDADAGLATSTFGLLSSEPSQPFADKLDLKVFYDLVHGGKVAVSYINGTEDIALPQGPDWGWHPGNYPLNKPKLDH